MKILLLSVLVVAMIGLMIPNAFSVTSQECSQTVTSSGNSNPDCLDPSKIEKPKSAMTELDDFTYVGKPNYYGYAGVFKFLDWGMIPATDGNYKILMMRGEITANTDSMKKSEGLITTPEDKFAIYNYGERSSLDLSVIEDDNPHSWNVDYDWKSDFKTPITFFLTAEMYPETHYTNPLQLYYSPVIYGTVVTSKNIQLDNLENLPYLELCHDVSKAKICGLDISLKDIRIEEGNQKDLLIVEFNSELKQSLRQITTESGSSSKDYSHTVYPYSCPFGVPSNIWEIPQKCEQGGETKLKNPEWTFWEECLPSNTKKLCFVIEKSDNSFSAASFSNDYEIKNYDTIFTIETDRESIKKSITKPSQQSSFTNENTKSEPKESIPEPQPKVETKSIPDTKILQNYEDWEMDMGITMDLPQDWEVTYYPATRDYDAYVDSAFYNPKIDDVDAFIEIIYDEDIVNFANSSNDEKIALSKEWIVDSDMDNLYTSTIFQDEKTKIITSGDTTVLFMVWDSYADESYYNSHSQHFMVQKNDVLWDVILTTYKQSDFYSTGETDRVFDTLRESFEIIESNEKPASSKNSQSVPSWIKNNAGWWAEGTIDDNSFVQGIQFMIKENIISIPNLPESSSETAESVPAWIKNNAGWWAEGQIDDNSFVKGIEYLVKVGIIQVS